MACARVPRIRNQISRNFGQELPKLWESNEGSSNEENVLQGNGQVKVMSQAMRDKINKFCVLNSRPMEKWFKRYEVEKL